MHDAALEYGIAVDGSSGSARFPPLVMGGTSAGAADNASGAKDEDGSDPPPSVLIAQAAPL